MALDKGIEKFQRSESVCFQPIDFPPKGQEILTIIGRPSSLNDKCHRVRENALRAGCCRRQDFRQPCRLQHFVLPILQMGVNLREAREQLKHANLAPRAMRRDKHAPNHLSGPRRTHTGASANRAQIRQRGHSLRNRLARRRLGASSRLVRARHGNRHFTRHHRNVHQERGHRRRHRR